MSKKYVIGDHIFKKVLKHSVFPPGPCDTLSIILSNNSVLTTGCRGFWSSSSGDAESPCLYPVKSLHRPITERHLTLKCRSPRLPHHSLSCLQLLFHTFQPNLSSCSHTTVFVTRSLTDVFLIEMFFMSRINTKCSVLEQHVQKLVECRYQGSFMLQKDI